MQARRPSAHVLRLDGTQLDGRCGRELLQPCQRLFLERERACGEASLDPQVFEVAPDVLVEGERLVHRARRLDLRQAAGSSRDSAALAVSPMRSRKSVPMSAV